MAKKVDKKNLSKKVNEVLGFEDEPIDFTKLDKDDLMKLHLKVKEPRTFIIETLMNKGENFIAEIVSTLMTQLGKEDKGKIPIGRGKLIKKFLSLLER